LPAVRARRLPPRQPSPQAAAVVQQFQQQQHLQRQDPASLLPERTAWLDPKARASPAPLPRPPSQSSPSPVPEALLAPPSAAPEALALLPPAPEALAVPLPKVLERRRPDVAPQPRPLSVLPCLLAEAPPPMLMASPGHAPINQIVGMQRMVAAPSMKRTGRAPAPPCCLAERAPLQHPRPAAAARAARSAPGLAAAQGAARP
jgi:hypothetical protein